MAESVPVDCDVCTAELGEYFNPGYALVRRATVAEACLTGTRVGWKWCVCLCMVCGGHALDMAARVPVECGRCAAVFGMCFRPGCASARP